MPALVCRMLKKETVGYGHPGVWSDQQLMVSESIAHSAFGLMSYNDSEPIRIQGIIIIVKSNVGTASWHRMLRIPCQKKNKN